MKKVRKQDSQQVRSSWHEIFPVREIGGLCWQVRQGCQRIAGLDVALADPDDFLDRRADILKFGLTTTVGRHAGLVLKRFDRRKLRDRLAGLFGRSKAKRACINAYRLEMSGVPTARAIAIADKRSGKLFSSKSYILTEEIAGAKHLGEWMGDPRHAIRTLAALIAMLHHAGFSHRDLKEKNIIFDATGKPFIIDLDGLRIHRSVSRTRALKDLMRLEKAAKRLAAFTPARSRRFLVLYAKARGLHTRELVGTAMRR
jgi:tRNA A-37 threonylcarbamoyl transferase component Bud32